METILNDFKSEFHEHLKSDEKDFGDIKNSLQKTHDIHVENRENIIRCLDETKKTNGRVTNLESVVIRLDKAISLLEQSNGSLYNIVSQQHNQYEKWVSQQERLKELQKDSFINKDQFEPVKLIVYGLAGLILTGVIGAIMLIVIVK